MRIVHNWTRDSTDGEITWVLLICPCFSMKCARDKVSKFSENGDFHKITPKDYHVCDNFCGKITENKARLNYTKVHVF